MNKDDTKEHTDDMYTVPSVKFVSQFNAVLSSMPTEYIGIQFSGDGARKFWRIECPCGVSVEYPVNGLPEVDTQHPCGNQDHWTVKYDSDEENR
jgi:hypothetical protein